MCVCVCVCVCVCRSFDCQALQERASDVCFLVDVYKCFIGLRF